MKSARQTGFTLPELLIALFIFALISGAAVYTLRLSIEGRGQVGRMDGVVRDLEVPSGEVWRLTIPPGGR